MVQDFTTPPPAAGSHALKTTVDKKKLIVIIIGSVEHLFSSTFTLGGVNLAKDKRDHRTMSHNGFRDNFNYATKGWDKKKRQAFHVYLNKEKWDVKNTWEKSEMVRQAEIWSTYYWWG